MSRAATPVKSNMTFNDYLLFEEQAEVKHEFVNGQLFLMAGGSDRHNRLAVLLTMYLAANEVPPCRTFMADMKLQTPNGHGYYPDVLVVCDDDDNETHYKKHPCLIAEVLSQSTEAIDRGEKLNNYRLCESLEAYVIINQDEPRLELYRRSHDGGFHYSVYEPGDHLVLPCVNVTIDVTELYQKV